MKTNQKTRHTLGLTMIMKDEVEDLDRIIKDYGSFFDKIYVTVTEQKTYAALCEHFTDNSATADLVELSYFKWIDHFGKARIFNRFQVKTDYWMWMDLDDEIEGAENISQVLKYVVANDLDVAWFQYEYIQRLSLSDPEVISNRERIIRTASGLEWSDEPVHESVNIKGDSKQELLSQVRIKHLQTAEHSLISRERNRLILEKEWLQTHRPITAYYLGVQLGELGKYEDAIEKLLFVAEHSESRVFRFAAWQTLCICYFQMGMYDKVLIAADECIAIDPTDPDPWYHKFTAYRAMGDHDSAMQFAEIFMSKPTPEGLTTLLNQDPSWRRYKGPFNIAHAYLSVGNIERAYELYNEVNTIAPEYIEEVSKATGIQWNSAFEVAYKNMSTTE